MLMTETIVNEILHALPVDQEGKTVCVFQRDSCSSYHSAQWLFRHMDG